MNHAFDYRGVQIAPSHPVAKLRTTKKTVYLDSGDRDITKYPSNGDYVVYLPRTYEKVVCISLKGAEFPKTVAGTGGAGALAHSISASGSVGDTAIDATDLYFFIEIEGLNKSDETAVAGDRSSRVDSVFAKIHIADPNNTIIYSEDTGPTNINYYQPAIGRLDRLHIRNRLHTQKGAAAGATASAMNTDGYVYWTADGLSGGTGGDYGLTLEIITLENSFDDYSSIESRISERGVGGFGC
jgi:hypothetical protein